MITTKIAAGDNAYLEDGEEVRVIEVGETYYVVEPGLDGGPEGEGPEYGEPHLAKRVYREPPCPRLHEYAAHLKEQIEAFEEKVAALRAEGAALKSAKDEIARITEKHRAIARVVDHIEGKTTHFVVCNWHGVRIQTADETTDTGEHNDKWTGHRKLVTLYGTKGGGLEWRLNSYRDGSGGSETTVIPCMSLDEAKAELAKMINEKIREIVALKHAHRLSDPIKDADKHGVPIADDVRAMARAYSVSALEKNLAEREKAASVARAELQAVLDGAPAQDGGES